MEVVIVGWKKGLKVVSLVQLLMKECGMGLKSAKSCADRVLTGEEVRVVIPDQSDGEGIRSRMEALGAVLR